MVGSILGNRVPRTEDMHLLTEGGTYVYDLELENVAYAYFVRSTAAHARITEIDIDDARNAPGVVGVITADELGIGQILSLIHI
mgnify:FL=1